MDRMALPGIWALVGLLAVIIAILGVVMMRGDDGKSGKIGFGISLFDMIEGATGVKVSKTTRLLWAIAMVAEGFTRDRTSARKAMGASPKQAREGKNAADPSAGHCVRQPA